MPPIHNHVFNHIAISVADCDAAAEWYNKNFGFKRIRNDRLASRASTPDHPLFSIYPASLQKVKSAWLSCGNGVGFEIFEFQDPPHVPEPDFHFTRSGFFHMAVTVVDADEAVKRVAESGGKLIGEVVDVGNGARAAYVTDPWGNVVEVLTKSFESLLANGV